MAENNESDQRNLSISIGPATGSAELVGRMLRNLGAFLSDVGELVEGGASLGYRPAACMQMAAFGESSRCILLFRSAS
jgi:hypothetical protein